MRRMLLPVPLIALAAAAPAAGEYDCVIKPDLIVKLGSPVEGALAEVDVREGDLVSKGQVMARLESRVQEVSVALAEARAFDTSRLELAKARVAFQGRSQERAERLFGKKLLSEAERDEAGTDVELAEAQVRTEEAALEVARLEHDRAVAQLEQRTVRSPIDGVVVERLMSEGEYAHEQAHILTLAALDPLEVQVFVPITDWGTVSVGDIAEVVPEAPVGGNYAAEIDKIDRVFDAASRTFGVQLSLDNPGYRLPAGLRCRVTFGAVTAGRATE